MSALDVYPKYPIDLKKASGSYVWDQNNTKYLDFYGGHAVISIGHNHQQYTKRLTQQLNEIGFYSNVIEMPMQNQLCSEMATISGYSGYHLFMCNSGAEANENAIKLAYHCNKRKKIIAFKGAFHGRTAMAAALTDDVKLKGIADGVFDIVFIHLNDYDSFQKAIDENTCAVILEGIQGVAGVHEAKSDFWNFISEQCQKYGALLIVDEIQSGCGRTGQYFAHQFHGIRADIVTMAKGIGNGFPVGAVLVSPEISVVHGLLGSTFGGNFLACAAALSVIEVLQEEKLMSNACNAGEYVMKKITGIDGVLDVRGRGLMIGVELDCEVKTIKDQLLFDHNIFVGSSGKNTLRVLPPMNIAKEDLDFFTEALTKTLSQVYSK